MLGPGWAVPWRSGPQRAQAPGSPLGPFPRLLPHRVMGIWQDLYVAVSVCRGWLSRRLEIFPSLSLFPHL